MNPLVPRKRGRMIEPLPALSTGVRLAIRMSSLVSGQRRRVIEALLTMAAAIWLFTCMHLSLYLSIKGEILITLGVHLCLQMDLVMSGQGRGMVETLVALRAPVGLSTLVNQLVLFEMAFSDEALPTLVALVGLLS